jgi:hypothetical protein
VGDIPFTTTITGVITAIGTLVTALALLVGAMPLLVKVLNQGMAARAASARLDAKIKVIHGLVNSTLTAAIAAELHASEGQLIAMRRLDATADDLAVMRALELRITELEEQLAERARQTEIGEEIMEDQRKGGEPHGSAIFD